METIALDLMGGDKGPAEIAKGAMEASSELDVSLILIGPREVLASHATPGQRNGVGVALVEASQVVGTSEAPTEAWREKQDSSIAVGVKLVKEQRAQAFVSAGNTGAIATASFFSLGTMEGIDRPAIATLFTTRKGTMALFLDIGANADCRPAFLLQFGQLGSAFMAKLFGIDRPRVALLSNGEEEGKGTRLVREAHKLLEASPLNFIGNVEGFDVLEGRAEVIVTDGFTGNVVLKLAEALTESIFLSLKEALGGSPLARASKLLWGPPIRSVVRQWDYSNIGGGAPLLGVNGNIVMAHGRSDAADIKNAVTLAGRMVREGWSGQPAQGEPPAKRPHLTN